MVGRWSFLLTWAYFQRLCISFGERISSYQTGLFLIHPPSECGISSSNTKTAPEKEWWQKRRWWHLFLWKPSLLCLFAGFHVKLDGGSNYLFIFTPTWRRWSTPVTSKSTLIWVALGKWFHDQTAYIHSKLGDSKGKPILKKWPCHFELVNFDQVDTDIYTRLYYTILHIYIYIYVNLCT